MSWKSKENIPRSSYVQANEGGAVGPRVNSRSSSAMHATRSEVTHSARTSGPFPLPKAQWRWADCTKCRPCTATRDPPERPPKAGVRWETIGVVTYL